MFTCGLLAVKRQWAAGGPRHKRGVTPTSEREPGQYSWAGTGVVANNSHAAQHSHSLTSNGCVEMCVSIDDFRAER